MTASLSGLIAKIHIAKVQMGLTDDEYRALLQGQTGKESCKQMTGAELRAVMMECQRLGWRPTTPGPHVPLQGEVPSPEQVRRMARPSNWNDAGKNQMYRKIYAMICANQAHGWSWGYVRGTARKMFERSRQDVVLEWLTLQELHSLVSALAIHSSRLARRA
ncbi:MAG: regulatory protein GemA [Magnetococcales bacterium]|nr:regulatory protein GemA [Magnetococcales bacterium]